MSSNALMATTAIPAAFEERAPVIKACRGHFGFEYV